MFLKATPIQKISWKLLEECRDESVEESRTLDFKEEGPKLYEGDSRDARDSKRDFLEHVCGFANAGGGLILLGIAERRDEHRKTAMIGELKGIALPHGFSDFKQKVEDMVRGSLDPRFFGIRLEEVPRPEGQSGLSVVAVGIENSIHALHRVNAHGSREFTLRMMKSTERLDAEEIRHAFYRSFVLAREAEDRLKKAQERTASTAQDRFRLPEKENQFGVRRGEVGVWLLALPTRPDALPLSIGDPRIHDALLALKESHRGLTAAWVKYDFLGAFLESSLKKGFPLDRVLRDGSVERWELVDRDATYIANQGLANALLTGFDSLKKLRGALGIVGPAFVFVGLFGAEGGVLQQIFKPAQGVRAFRELPPALPSGALFAPVEETSDEFFGLTLKRVADFFWQAGGHRVCAGIGEQGEPTEGWD